MKLILRIGNLFPLFLALLLLDTAWKQGWQHLAARTQPGSFWNTIAGAAAYQRG